MKKSLLLSFVLLTAVLLMTACQPAVVNSNMPMRQMSASGMGQVYLKPDVAYVYIGVQSLDEGVSQALADNNSKAQAVAKALTDLGVKSDDIQTSAFNVIPQPQYDPQSGQQSGIKYMVDNTVYVTVRDLQSLGQVLDSVVRAGANSINGVTFDVLDKESAMNEARELAIADAKKNAEAMAKAAGITLGEIYTLSVYNSGSPVPVFEGKGGMMNAGQAPISAGQLVLTVNADVTYALK